MTLGFLSRLAYNSGFDVNLHTIISNNTFKVTICDLKNKDRNMADNIEKKESSELITKSDQLDGVDNI